MMGVQPVAAGEDTQWHARFSIGWPDWVVLLFCVFAVAFVVGIYLKEGGTASRSLKFFLAIVRLLVIALIVMMIGGLEISIDRTGLPYLVFMVDDSESMSVEDQRESAGQTRQSRLQRVVEWMSRSDSKPIRELTQQHKLQLYAHSTAPRLLGTYLDSAQVDEMREHLSQLQPAGSESRLGSNLRSVLNSLRGTPPSAVVMITDGVTTKGESLQQAAQYAARKQIPVFTIGVGDPNEQQDLELADLLVDPTVFVDDNVTFEAKLSGQGFAGKEVTVQLKEKGNDTPLDEQKYTIDEEGKPVRVRLNHRPTQPGTYEYTLTVPVEERELVAENNSLQRRIQVVDEKVRVLYVDSFPRYEFRYLKNLLERERTVELSVLLLDADPEYVQQDRTAIGFFPTSKQELFEFDVLIFGDVAPSLLSQAQLANVEEFVQVKGGGFLLIAGRNFAPQSYRDTVLEDFLPIEIGPAANAGKDDNIAQGFTPRLTLEGKASPMFRFAADAQENEKIWNNFPPVFWFAHVDKAKPGAQVLVEHPSLSSNGEPLPIVATQFFGAGRTYFQGFDSTWRWRHRVEDLYHGRYWVQTIRYLSRAKLLGKNRAVEFLLDQRKYQRGEPVTIRVRFLDESIAPKSDDGVTVVLEQQGQGQQTLTLHRLPGPRAIFETVLGQSRDGKYSVRLSNPVLDDQSPPTEEFEVVPPPGELDNVQLNEAELRQVAQATGAAFYPLDQADRIFTQLPKGRRVALHTDPPIPLWNTWPVLAVFFSLLLLEWVLRKRQSMV